ncbi:MAG: lipopolysaccharide biosynthesis protein, partial [Bacteroidota bacterium]|nr:lipopolysaccharide biosynthesis protein [Bacteroidota bacterium]
LPDTYISASKISTGLADQSQNQFIESNNNSQESKIDQQFSNLLQSIQMKKMLDQVSYLLMIHDLTSDTPYRKPSKLLLQLNDRARKHALEVYTRLYESRQALSLWDEDQKGLNKVLISMGYDEKSLKKKMTVFRLNNSDYINIEFESDSPVLSAFVVNTLTDEFINYYSSLIRDNSVKATNFLDSVLKQKWIAMDTQMNGLKEYKIKNRVLNLNEQAKSLYAQIADFETRRDIAEKDILSITGALKSIDDKFNPKDRKYLESTLAKINQQIIATKDNIKQLNDDYVRSNYDVRYKKKIDSLSDILTAQINSSTDKYILNPLAAKESLVLQKMNLEVQLDLARNGISTLKNELDRLNKKFDMLVPHEAVIQSYEGAIDIASKEYIEILKKFNQTSMESNFLIKLKQVEIGMPGQKQPSKKMLLVALSGVLSFVFCMVLMFILFYLDDSIHLPKELADKTNLPVLGFLPFIKTSLLDFNNIWNEETDNHAEFKKLLRSTRFEIGNEMDGNKILLLTSLNPMEGKTILALSLAYAYSSINKKVLVIDGNFSNPSITSTTNSTLFLEDLLQNKISVYDIQSSQNINILGTRGGDISLLELSDAHNIVEKLAALKNNFDIIIIETAALSTLNKSKEWIDFGDKLVAVFEANQTISFSKNEDVNYLKSLDNKFIGWVLNKVGNRKKQSNGKK